MLTKEDIKDAIEFDDAAAAAGGYIDTKAKTIAYRLRDMYNYCVAQGKDIEKLTPDEREMFRVPASKEKSSLV
jgi:hypothetical protein